MVGFGYIDVICSTTIASHQNECFTFTKGVSFPLDFSFISIATGGKYIRVSVKSETRLGYSRNTLEYPRNTTNIQIPSKTYVGRSKYIFQFARRKSCFYLLDNFCHAYFRNRLAILGSSVLDCDQFAMEAGKINHFGNVICI